MTGLRAAALRALTTADALDKARVTRELAAAWFNGAIGDLGVGTPPERPARPERPRLAPPREMAKRGRGGSEANRGALFHALAHIELNAIDLAWDIVARPWADAMPRAFLDDWVRVADDEARHFVMLEEHMAAGLGIHYGDLPAHDGLWLSAIETADDLAARLAVVPMTLEARGLDVTPQTIERLRGFGDAEGARILDAIFNDEIDHVAAGCRWFNHVAWERGADPATLWRDLIAAHFKGRVKPPFNVDARTKAGMPERFYADLD